MCGGQWALCWCGGGCSESERDSSRPARFQESVAMKYYYRETTAVVAAVPTTHESHARTTPTRGYIRTSFMQISCWAYQTDINITIIIIIIKP